MANNNSQATDNIKMLRVQCESSYYVRWADSTCSSCGVRSKETWIERPEKYKDADHIELSGQLWEDDYCGGDPSLLINSCDIVFRDRQKEKDIQLGEELAHLLNDMWERHPPIF